MNTLQINIFGFNPCKFPFTLYSLNEICNISDENKDKILLTIFTHKDDQNKWIEELSKEKYDYIDKKIHVMPNHDYLEKVKLAQETNCKYSAKIDEDVFMNRYLLDFIIDNLPILDKDPSASLIAPILTTGIPSVDFFLDDFFSPDEKEEAYQIFLDDGLNPINPPNILDLWGCDYRNVHKVIQSMKRWDYNEYWNAMEVHNPIETKPWMPSNYYWAKGLHPVRYSEKYARWILSKVIKYETKFLEKQNYFLQKIKTTYFVNCCFFTTTNFWKNSLAILHDGYDEGQMTIYAKQHNMEPLYVRNGFGIHMVFNGVPNQSDIENEYIKHFYARTTQR